MYFPDHENEFEPAETAMLDEMIEIWSTTQLIPLNTLRIERILAAQNLTLAVSSTPNPSATAA